MSAPHPPTGGATEAEIAAALAALVAVASSGGPADPPAGDGPPERSAWRSATGPLPGAWPARGWRTPTRARSWS